MRVAIIASGFLPVLDGVTVSGMRRLEQLSIKGHEVLLFCPDVSCLEPMYPNWKDYTGKILPGVEVVTLESIPLPGADFDRNVSRHSHKKLMERLENFKPDIIHVDEPERLFIGFLKRPGLSYSKKAGVPCVGFFRTNFLEYFEDAFKLPRLALSALEFTFLKLLKYVYNGYDLTLVSSTVTHKKLKEYGIRNTKLAELHGVDLKSFGPHLREDNYFAKKYDITNIEDTVKLLFLGRLTADKNWRFTYQALKECVHNSDFKNVSVLVAGDGDLKDEISHELGCFLPHVHMLGRVSPDEIPALLANCDIHVTTSEKETRGLTILEAFASGVPVLAPAAGGVVQNIQTGQNGYLYEPGSLQDFREKLCILVENETQRKKMGEVGLSTIATLDWTHAVDNLIAIWQELINSKLTRKGTS